MSIEMTALLLMALVSVMALGALALVCYMAILRERRASGNPLRSASEGVTANPPKVAFFSGPQGMSPPREAK